MDEQRARELLHRARTDTEAELARSMPATGSDARDPADDHAGEAENLTERGTDGAVNDMLARRLVAIEQAEQRLAAGTYGKSVLSGKPIPDGRLEVEPWAELTVDEQAQA